VYAEVNERGESIAFAFDWPGAYGWGASLDAALSKLEVRRCMSLTMFGSCRLLCGGLYLLSVGDYPEIMNVEEVADLLHVGTQTVYSLASPGKLPAVKVGRQWARVEVRSREGFGST